MTIDERQLTIGQVVGQVAIGIEELKAEMARHHAWVEEYFDGKRKGMADLICELSDRVAEAEEDLCSVLAKVRKLEGKDDR